MVFFFVLLTGEVLCLALLLVITFWRRRFLHPQGQRRPLSGHVDAHDFRCVFESSIRVLAGPRSVSPRGMECERQTRRAALEARGSGCPAATQGPRSEGHRDDENSAWALPALKPIHIWSYDFVSVRTLDGGPVRVLNVVDEFTRVALGSHVARSIGAAVVVKHLEKLFQIHGRRR